MKTKDQVIRQLKELKFADDEWNKTQKFLNSVGIKPKRATKSGAIDCSFDDFMDWYQHGYGSGDIVGYGRTAIVVSFCFQDTLMYLAILGWMVSCCCPKNLVLLVMLPDVSPLKKRSLQSVKKITL